ncbi:aminotransferase class IV [Planctomicrobium sp. SH661]|uniref:aminotransferase class IV n=1 Tax=Planctomicrobium sp. SH661 TaxID=3448124 RepID=UPI003F5BB82A
MMADLPSSTVPIAYLNGEFIPFTQAQLPVFDLGIVQGATVTERLRTVRHQPYQVREHLDRLQASLAAVGWSMPLDMGPLEDVLAELARVNSKLIPPHSDLSLVIFVTAGQALGDANQLITSSRPSVCAYTAPLPFAGWVRGYEQGVHLITPEVRQIAGDVIPPAIKHRSRLNWYLADQQARRADPVSMALLLDQQGFVTETASGNLFIVRGDELFTPSAETTLSGIAQAHVMKLAERQGWKVQRAHLTPQQVASASEAFLTSSTYCMLPVSMLNGTEIGTSVPGRVTKMLMDNWSEEIGLDFERQTLRFSAGAK